MQKDNEKKDWMIRGFPVTLRLWFAGWCKENGKPITKGLEEVINKFKQNARK